MRIIISIVVMLICVDLSGQEGEWCHSTIQNHEKRMDEDPEYKEHIKEWLSKTAPIIKQRREDKNPTCTAGPLMIPVAVHFNSGLVMPSEEACVITIVQDQIDELNLEMLGLDSDAGLINNFTSCFGANILGDACIEFCIASQNHPAGYGLMNGDLAITFGQVNFFYDISAGFYTPVNPEWAGYVNIYVDNIGGGILGVSYGIPGQFNGSGVLVDNCVFGTGNINCTGVQTTGSGGCTTTYDEGETLAHEIGHYFGLRHIWGDNSNCNGAQDNIPDTPDMATSYSGYTNCNHNNCGDLPQTCGSEDMYMNFMSYAGDGCMYMFTSDQSDVMYATALAEGYTISSSKCSSTPNPIANFSPTGNIDVCSVDGIQFTDLSTNNPTSWSWTFTVVSGNITIDIPTSSLQNPLVMITSGSSGTVSTELTVSNAAGNDMITQTQNVNVITASTYYEDTDGDGFGNSAVSFMYCLPPAGVVQDNTDCDDSDATVYPGAPELCDGQINNCNITTLPLDEVDNDNDKYVECDVDAGGWDGSSRVAGGGDCDDANPNVNPAATEVCDGIDNDCDGMIDESGTAIYYADTDGDTYGDPNNTITICTQPSGYVTDNTDCNDSDPNINPAAIEICDGIDNNCNGMIDEGGNLYYADTDGDAFGDPNNAMSSCTQPSGYVSDNTDCDDTDATVYPGAIELCDGQINDCNTTTLSNNEVDNDMDGYVECTIDAGGWDGVLSFMGGDDCDDMEAANYPGNIEACDGIDNNCNGLIDEELLTTYYADTDGDGFGDVNVSVLACNALTGYVTDNTDCDDTEAANYPGNAEVCDGIDNNCDGNVDEGCGPNPDCDGDYIVINTITNYTYRAEINILSDAVIDENGQSILFAAGTDIDLVYPFEVILGTTFEARIEPCTPMPVQNGNTPEANALDDNNALDALFLDYSNVRLSISIKNSEGVITNNLSELGAQASDVVSAIFDTLAKGMYAIEIQDRDKTISQKILLVK